MLGSGGPKAPENRIHLFDPVGLINDSYGGYRSSSYTVQPPRRPTKSFDSFTDAETNTSSGAVRSDDSLTDSNNRSLRSYDVSSKDTNGGGDVELRFGVDPDDSDSSTPRLWRPSPLKNLKCPPATATSTANPSLKSKDSSPLYTASPPPKSVTSSPLQPTNPTSPKSVTSSPLRPTSLEVGTHPTSLNSVTSSPLHPTGPNSLGSPSPNSLGSPVNPTHSQYQTMSPSSRTQVIAKGRKELMDMVRDLPESFYELSLKDIVDQKLVTEKLKEVDLPEEPVPVKEPVMENTKKQKSKKGSKKVKKSESKKKMVRSKSVDSGGFLLRTSVFPSFLGARKKKKSLSAASSFKVAPMSKSQPAPTRSMKGTEKDWWKRKSCISSESEESNVFSSNSGTSSSSSSSRSNSSSGRRNNKFLRSFCFFNGRRIRGKT